MVCSPQLAILWPTLKLPIYLFIRILVGVADGSLRRGPLLFLGLVHLFQLLSTGRDPAAANLPSARHLQRARVGGINRNVQTHCQPAGSESRTSRSSNPPAGPCIGDSCHAMFGRHLKSSFFFFFFFRKAELAKNPRYNAPSESEPRHPWDPPKC